MVKTLLLALVALPVLASSQPLDLPYIHLITPELAGGAPTGRWIPETFQTRSDAQAHLDLLTEEAKAGARVFEISSGPVVELQIQTVCTSVIAAAAPPIVECSFCGREDNPYSPGTFAEADGAACHCWEPGEEPRNAIRAQADKCDSGTAWANGGAWGMRSVGVVSPDDMPKSAPQLGADACRPWGPDPTTDVFPNRTPLRAAAE